MRKTIKAANCNMAFVADYREGGGGGGVGATSCDAAVIASTPQREIEEMAAATPTLAALRVAAAQSPMDALRVGMVSPFRSFLGLLKPPPLPGLSLHGSTEAAESPRPSTDTDIESSLSSPSSSSRVCDAGRKEPRQSVVMVAFDAAVKEISHAGIVWAMEHVLKRGDVLTIMSVLDTVRGPLGYRVKIMGASQRGLAEEEVQQAVEAWRSFPGLERRCEEGGVKLVVTVKASQRGELEICKEAMKLGACHVVLDKSLRNRHRGFYLQNMSCNVTRMRRGGGVDVIRPSSDMAMAMGSGPLNGPSEMGSPTSVIPVPVLSYGDQIDEFEISLRAPTPTQVSSVETKSSPTAAVLSPRLQFLSSEERHLGELGRRIEGARTMATAHRRASSVSQSTTSTQRTSSSNATDREIDDAADDDLFSIFHGSTRIAELDGELLNPSTSSSGYESDDLFSIGNASPLPPSTLHHHPHHRSSSLSIPDTALAIHAFRFPADAAPATSCDLVISEPLREATISRITFVVGLGDAAILTLRSPLRPGEGLLVGSSPSALFLVHADHQQRATISTATPNSYIAMEGQMAMKLSFLEPEQRVLAVDALGRCRAIRVEGAATEKKPLALVEVHCEGRRHGVLLPHTEGVGLRHSHSQSWGAEPAGGMVSVSGLKLGDRVLLRVRSAEPSHAIWSS